MFLKGKKVNLSSFSLFFQLQTIITDFWSSLVQCAKQKKSLKNRRITAAYETNCVGYIRQSFLIVKKNPIENQKT